MTVPAPPEGATISGVRCIDDLAILPRGSISELLKGTTFSGVSASNPTVVEGIKWGQKWLTNSL